MTKLAHQVLEDGRVLVSFVGRDTVHINAAEAKRFAWALLADLDPDELPAQPRPKAARPGVQAKRVLGHLLLHPRATAQQIAGALGISRDAANMCLNRLRQHGHAVQVAKAWHCPKRGLARSAAWPSPTRAAKRWPT